MRDEWLSFSIKMTKTWALYLKGVGIFGTITYGCGYLEQSRIYYNSELWKWADSNIEFYLAKIEIFPMISFAVVALINSSHLILRSAPITYISRFTSRHTGVKERKVRNHKEMGHELYCCSFTATKSPK